VRQPELFDSGVRWDPRPVGVGRRGWRFGPSVDGDRPPIAKAHDVSDRVAGAHGARAPTRKRAGQQLLDTEKGLVMSSSAHTLFIECDGPLWLLGWRRPGKDG